MRSRGIGWPPATASAGSPDSATRDIARPAAPQQASVTRCVLLRQSAASVKLKPALVVRLRMAISPASSVDVQGARDDDVPGKAEAGRRRAFNMYAAIARTETDVSRAIARSHR